MKGGEKNKPLCINTTICNEYQKLLEECESALEIWDEHRAEVCESRLVGREAGDELLRLQAKFARAYAVLQRHSQDCLLCQLASDMQMKRASESGRPEARNFWRASSRESAWEDDFAFGAADEIEPAFLLDEL